MFFYLHLLLYYEILLKSQIKACTFYEFNWKINIKHGFILVILRGAQWIILDFLQLIFICTCRTLI